ncbi:putative Mg2+ transporter-C (MgtC) family protein [Methylopila capsulata]|uniref:Protein MgtC n=1 Tax=Methylopila capsulata TaxID=61654 RepID=A0A9W6IU97_9HYPH|nr:MgtC/SapB family protein [Methylopila capsulata]MBM7850124.1 putative Mg2+ transporter-C (MgtC) family protein [Methylopila capsulata]GLK55415.1 magnesium transporter [Methylopila capsulata]
MRELTDPYFLDACLRLAAAAGCGIAIGLNRDLKSKPVGMRTLGLVSVGAALISLSALQAPELRANPDAYSRVVQGILQGVLTGIGFLGAGAILKRADGPEIKGLTTAAAVWATAALGVACALAEWPLVAVGLAVTLAVLIVPKRVAGWFGRDDAD